MPVPDRNKTDKRTAVKADRHSVNFVSDQNVRDYGAAVDLGGFGGCVHLLVPSLP